MTDLTQPSRAIASADPVALRAVAERRASAVHDLGRYWNVPVARLADREGEPIVRVIASAANGDALLVRVTGKRFGRRHASTVYATSTRPGDPTGTPVPAEEVDAWFREHSGRTA